MYKFLFCFHLYKSFAFKTLNRIAPSFRSAPVFLPPLYKSFAFNPLNATSPFPQVFSLSPFPLAREPTVTAWRGTTLGRDITNVISLIMPLRFVRRLRNNMAQSLVLYVKSDARCGRRLAAPIPSSKLHIPFISTLRIGFRIRLRLPQLFIINY